MSELKRHDTAIANKVYSTERIKEIIHAQLETTEERSESKVVRFLFIF